jgi:hypothetical protein
MEAGGEDKKKARPPNGLAFKLKLSADGQLALFRIAARGTGVGAGGRRLTMSARPQAESTGRKGHEHDRFENFQLMFRLLSELVAAAL